MACSDGDACTSGDVCKAASCTPGTPLGCDDGNVCTSDGCAAKSGCTHVANTKNCNDGDACTSADACKDKACKGSVGVDCDDGNPCTVDTCEKVAGCQHAPATASGGQAPCDDGSACTTVDGCVDGQCVGSKPPSCDDGNPCTSDGCEPASGCVHADVNVGGGGAVSCDDGEACTAGDVCADKACAPGAAVSCDDGQPCTDDLCTPAQGCASKANSAACDDGNACTTTDLCSSGSCVGSGAPSCDDGNPCTKDSCSASKGCVHEELNAQCDDGNACTEDSCKAGSGCVHAPKSGSCTPSDTCSAGGSCQLGSCVSKGARLFTKTAGGAGTDTYEAVVPIVVAGASGDTLAGTLLVGSTSSTQLGDRQCWLRRLDAGGAVVYDVKLGGAGEERCNGAATSADGAVLVGELIDDLSNKPDGLLLRVDAQGKLLSSKLFGGLGKDHFVAAFALPGGDHVIVGSYQEASADEAWILRVDATDKVVFDKTWSAGKKAEETNGGAVAADGTLLVVGTTKNTPDDARDAFVLNFDGKGTLLWQSVFGAGSTHHFGNAVAQLPSGGLLVAGQVATLTDKRVWLVGLDGKGKVDWERQITALGLASSEMTAISTATAGGGAVAALVGRRRALAATTDDLWLLRTDAYGNLHGDRAYAGSTSSYAEAVAIAPNGDLLIAGVKATAAGDADGWLLHTDAWGFESCAASGGCHDKAPAACDDGKSCTADGCDAGSCKHTAHAKGAMCTPGAADCASGVCP